jgi:hypothetical protein
MVTNWWVSGGFNPPTSYAAALTATLELTNGQLATVAGLGEITMARPQAKITAITASVNLITTNGETDLVFGASSNQDGILFSNTIALPSGFSGTVEWAQVDFAPFGALLDGSGISHRSKQNGPGPYLDTTFPYTKFRGNAPVDSPSVRLDDLNKLESDSDDFEMLMMFQPPGGHLVPLRAVDWSWLGRAINRTNGWVLVAGTNSVNPQDFDTEEYPFWMSNVTNYQWIPPL